MGTAISDLKQKERFPKGWSKISLGNLASFQTGKLDSNAAVLEGKYPFFTCAPQTLRTDTYSFDTECVLLAGNNAAGVFPIKYFTGKFDAYQRTYIIESLDKTRLDNRYLFFALQPELEKLRKLSIGSATQYLTLKILKNFSLSIPPIEEQKKITEILIAIEGQIKSVEDSSSLHKQLKQGLMQHLLTRGIGHTRFKQTKIGEIPESWDVTKLEDFASPKRSTMEPREFPNEKFELYSIPAFHETGVPEVVQGKEIGSMKQLVSKDTILFGALNPKVPKIWYVSSDTSLRKIASSEFICLDGNEKSNPRYIFHLCQSSRLLEKSMNLVRGTTPSRMRVDRDAFLSLPVPVPPTEEQRKIAEILDTIDFKIKMENEIHTQMNNLKKGLMQVLLTGKVRVKT